MAELAGRATPQGTAAVARGVVIGPGLVLSAVGVGVHGLAEGDVLRARAITHAISRGVTWVVLTDPRPTAAAALGRCLREAVAAGTLARESLVLGVELDAATIDASLAEVRAALGVEVDLVVARVSGTLDRCDGDALQRTVDTLHALVQQDRAASFAVAAAVDHDFDLDVLASRLASLRDASCGAWFVPINPVEHAAIASRADGRSPRAIATALGIATIATRTIATRTADGPLRLVERHRVELVESITSLRRLEGAWASGLGRRIRTAEGDAVDLFRWGAVLSDPAVQGHDNEAWQKLRHEVIAPHVGRAAAALLGHLQGPDRDEFAAWWQVYGTALHHTFTAIERGTTYVDPTRAVARHIDPLLPPTLHTAPLPVRAVGFALAAGASAACVGIRTPAEAATLTDAFAEPPPPIASDVLDAALRTIAATHTSAPVI